jgi:hypothetical protein
VEAVFIDVGPDGRDLGDLVPHRLGVFPLQCAATARAVSRLDLEDLSNPLGWDQGSSVPLMAGLTSTLPPGRGAGGRRLTFTAGWSVEGGLEELVEFRLSRTSKSVIRFSKETMTARMAVWASAGTVSQSDSGIGG